jgi:hypothetical protein
MLILALKSAGTDADIGTDFCGRSILGNMIAEIECTEHGMQTNNPIHSKDEESQKENMDNGSSGILQFY